MPLISTFCSTVIQAATWTGSVSAQVRCHPRRRRLCCALQRRIRGAFPPPRRFAGYRRCASRCLGPSCGGQELACVRFPAQGKVLPPRGRSSVRCSETGTARARGSKLLTAFDPTGLTAFHSNLEGRSPSPFHAPYRTPLTFGRRPCPFVNGGRNPPKSGDAFISGSDNASSPTRDTVPKRGHGLAAALCSLAKRTLDAA